MFALNKHNMDKFDKEAIEKALSDWQKGRQSYLTTVQHIALDSCATALRHILFLQEEARKSESSNQGNLLYAKKSIIDAMVNLAIVASQGCGYDKIKGILSEYGLEDMI